MVDDRSESGQGSRLGRYYRDAATIVIVATSLTALLWKPWSSISEMQETFFLVLILSIALHFASPAARKAEGLLTTIAKSKFAIWLVAIVGLAVASSLSLLIRLPQPQVSDEFSNLLAGDTFAHGRLTNPTHPMWIHFESFHILQTPSYMTKFPPAQGMMLALGQILGSPAIGVWISTALVCAAIFWMLKQWVPANWALVASITASLHPEMLEWSYGFFGGQIAMAGGALTIGAFRRLMKGPDPRGGMLAGMGMAIMANSRPYEGFVLTIVLTALWSIWVRIGKQFTWSAVLRRFIAPASAVVLLTALAMGLYNYRVTGNAVKLPYMVYEATYDPVPLFLWQKARPVPSYNNPEFQALYAFSQLPFFERIKSFTGFQALTWSKTQLYINEFLLGFVALLVVVLVPLLFKADKLSRLVAVILLLFCAGQLPEVWYGTRYFAPAASLCLLLPLLAMRHWRAWRWKKLRFGLLFMRVLVVVTLLYFGNSFRIAIRDLRASPADWHYQRAKLIRSLSENGARNLVLVRYAPGYDVNAEWVYNTANIDESAVVWARDLGEAKNQKLLNYFQDRRAWLLTIGPGQASFGPYGSNVPEAQRTPAAR